MLFDTHNHLQDFDSAAIPDIMKRAAQAGVTRMAVNGTFPGDWQKVLEIARENKGVVPCFGLHPWHISKAGQNWLPLLEEFLKGIPSCVGEIGLDGALKDADGAEQEKAFILQLELACRLNRPAVIHCVRAWGRMAEILKKHAPAAGFMLHAYGGPPDIVPGLADLGAYFSFTGDIENPEREKLRKALAIVPEDRLLFETESPFLSGPPHPEKSWQREPAGIKEVIKSAARILGKDFKPLVKISATNAQRFFKAVLTGNL
ncbi:MAG: TatD family hydrolase [bacterium]